MTCSAVTSGPASSALVLGLEVMAHHRRQEVPIDTHRVTTELGHTTGEGGRAEVPPREPQGWSHRILSEAGGGRWARLGSLLAGPPHGGVESEGENEAGLDPQLRVVHSPSLSSSTTSILPPP